MRLCVCDGVYNGEITRLCKSYLDAVDTIIPRESNLLGDIDVPLNRILLRQLKALASMLDMGLETRAEISKRIYFLELHGVSEAEQDADADADLQKTLLEVSSCYSLCVEALSQGGKEIEAVSLTEELTEKLRDADFSDRCVLVGALRSPRQLGICLKRKFYHIPARQIEEYAIPEYVAIYQSENMFGSEQAGVKYYGRVKKCTPVRRSKIKEIPKKSNELYYKFKIKEWIRLDNTVLAKELGFIRLFTTPFLLENAEEVPELTHKSRYDFALYRLLKLANRELEAEQDCKKIFSGFYFEGFEIIFTRDAVYLCRDKAVCKKYKRLTIFSSPLTVFEGLRDEIEEGLRKNAPQDLSDKTD